MNTANMTIAAWLVLASASALSSDETGECFSARLKAHVQDQFAVYGRLSDEHEYFGYIYRREGTIESAVTRSGKCPKGHCLIDTREAAALIPRGSKVLGEWHTHPRDGSAALSAEDVRGARNNRHIRCYSAFYSKPNGEILSWEPSSSSVPIAMASRVSIGNYAERLVANIDDQGDRDR